MISFSPPAILNSEGAERKPSHFKGRRGKGREIHRIQRGPELKFVLEVSCLQDQGMSTCGLKAVQRTSACAALRQRGDHPEQSSKAVLKELTWALSKFYSFSRSFIKGNIVVVLIKCTQQSLLTLIQLFCHRQRWL